MARVAVIGGGISGLAAAHRLVEIDRALDVRLFEAAARLGGVLETTHENGYCLEHSADNFLTSLPWARDLCRRIGFEDQLIGTNPEQRHAFVVRRGRLVKLPEGFSLMAPGNVWALAASPVLSWRGKLRLAAECVVPRRRDGTDESLASFARRRLGREAFERLVQPLVSGIYTADPERLSMRAALPRFFEMERTGAGLIRGVRREARLATAVASGARYSLFMAPRGGLVTLVAALAARLPQGTVRLGSPVERIVRRTEGGWTIELAQGSAVAEDFDAVIVATPAHRAAALVADIDPRLAGDLRSIRYAGCAIALVGYRRDAIEHPLNGFGFVVPEVEKRPILACSFSSVKFPDRAPPGHVLLRVFFGGACHPKQETLDDAALRRIVREELGELLGARGEPTLFRVARWQHAMPQYDVGHCDVVDRIEECVASLPGLALAGNAYHGVGVPQCIHSGEQAAQRVLQCMQPNANS